MKQHAPPATEPEQSLVPQVESMVGGRVTSIEREGRWRAAWRVDVVDVVDAVEGGGVNGGEPRRLYLRGERSEGNDLSLETEAAIHALLEKHGVPVPHVYGLTAGPKAMVMDLLTGSGQLTGVSDPVTQQALLDEYVGYLVQVHRIPLEEVAAAGVEVPASPVEAQLALFRRRARKFRAQQARPEPLVAFGSRWALRHQPTHRDRMGLAIKDTGQFLQRGGSITGLYDLELAHVTDPQADLAGLRVRNAFEPLGDLAWIFDRYVEASGDPIDPAVVNFHQVVGGLAGRQAITRLRTEERADYVNWLTWEVAGAFSVLSAIAEELGEELDPAPPDLDDTPEPLSGSLVRALDAWVGPTRPYDRVVTDDLLNHIQLVLRHGPSLAASHLADVESLVGFQPTSVHEADAALEDLVREAGPDTDRRILHLLHRSAKRQRALIPSMLPNGRPPGSVGPFVDRFRLEAVRSVMARMG
ncbi:phosphotransferase [Pseudonocardia oroxyli]|uniref:phosphotransferase n=1 Tax=Pseudonocardia oroxyli TaxID=366584 RepID=UPI0015A16EF1|nr:phosphotransferase [Pseudonocardia oroxyli]